jgi:anhydro-N-acetylmuramic acid kinase
MNQSFRVIGLMSGSSLDGLDIAYCQFNFSEGNWSFEMLKTDVIPITPEWIKVLQQLPSANAKALWEKHTSLGHYFGEQVKHFITHHNLGGQVDFVSSHGHTIFHFPNKYFTTQIADGAAIASVCGLPVVCDFRSADIAHGGQGTPIVPIGDLHLFRAFRFCLNVGGIANISCKTEKSVVAFDICAANQVLNKLANHFKAEYDEDGKLAASGSVNIELLEELNQLDYYAKPYPKSLDNSFSRESVMRIIDSHQISSEDKLRTYTEHIALQLSTHIQMICKRESIQPHEKDKMLVTGGGAFNRFLMQRIKVLSGIDVIVPDEEIVKFKEALVIAFMGVLRMRKQANVLCSVTGASKDTIGGAVYLP